MHVCPKCGDSAAEPGQCTLDSIPMCDARGDDHLGIQLGPYRIARLLGSGGMGRVYLGVHPEIGSRVAVKIFSRDWDTREDLVDRFFAEARATNLIRHEHIINVLDVNRLDSGRPYLIMEYLPGKPLSVLIAEGKLTESGILYIMLDVLAGLGAAHEHHIIHRDLKPDNIFVSPEGIATLLDFGVAKLIPEIMGDSGPTTTGAILGTPHYMSPEQAVGDPIDVRTDLYALGIILFECFTGRRPFDATSLYKLLDQHVNQPPPRPGDLCPEISPEVEAVILHALEKKPAERYQVASEMREALAKCKDACAQAMRLRIEVIEGDWYPASLPTQPGTQDGGTPATVVANPQRRAQLEARATRYTKRAETEEASSGVGYWLAGGGLTLLALFAVWQWPSEVQDKKPTEPVLSMVAAAPVSWDAASPPAPADVAPVDAGVTDAFVADAASPDAAVVVPRGVTPLSLLRRARREAQRTAHDVVLERISVRGLTPEGRILLREKGTAITFYFFSSILLQKSQHRTKHTQAKHNRCQLSVTYERGMKPKVTQHAVQCERVVTVGPPGCPIGKLLAKKADPVFKPKLGPDDRLRASYSGRSFNFNSTAGWQVRREKKWHRLKKCK